MLLFNVFFLKIKKYDCDRRSDKCRWDNPLCFISKNNKQDLSDFDPPNLPLFIFTFFLLFIHPFPLTSPFIIKHNHLSLSSFIPFFLFLFTNHYLFNPRMAAAGDLFRHGLPEVGGAGKLHVLAVDDSHVDRKVIERLLKISSCKGKELKMLNLSVFCCSFSIGF